MFYLYWDDSAAESDLTKLRRARYATLAEAKAQAEHDLAVGKNVVCIEESKKPLGGDHLALERGTSVWEP